MRAERIRRGNNVKGRKRHLLVDMQGLLLKAKVHAANIMDWDGIKMLHCPIFGHKGPGASFGASRP
jgi:hypothetical protein